MDSIPPPPPPGQRPPSEEPQSDIDPRRSLRKRIRHEAPENVPDDQPLAKRKASRPAPTFHPPAQKNGRIFVDYRCLRFPKSHRLDMEPLIREHSALEHIPNVFTEESGVAGTGVFADRDYDKYEIVGFYRGQLMKHFPVPPDVIDRYCRDESIDPATLPKLVLATWIDHPEKPAEFITLSDSHTLWSGITVHGDEDEDIELGINGLNEGNSLAYLNHVRPGNVRPIPTLCPSASFISNKKILHAKKGIYGENDVWIPIVTTKKVSAGEELGFDYDKGAEQIRFALVGYDLFKKPQKYLQVEDDHVSQLTELAPQDTSSDTSSMELESLDSSIPDFRSSLSEEEKVLVEQWLNRDPETHKILNERIRAQDERAVQLMIFLAGHEQGLRVADVSGHLTRMAFRFESDRPKAAQAYRDYVCRNFQKQEAAKILQIASIDPEELIQMGDTRTKAESHALLANISEDTPEAHQHLDAYLRRAFYASNREKRTDRAAIYDGITTVLQPKAKILGVPGHTFSQGYVYRYMVKRELFEPEDIVRNMPIAHLIECLSSDNIEEIDQGIEDLDRYAGQWIKDDKGLGRLASQLQRNDVPNIMGGGAHWDRVQLEQLPSVKSMFATEALINVPAMVDLWIQGDSKTDLDIREYLKTHGDAAFGEVARALKQQPGWSLKDVVKCLEPLKIEGLNVNIVSVRDAIFSQFSDKSVKELSELLEGTVHVFYRKAKAFYAAHGGYEGAQGEQLDCLFSESEWQQLKEEFEDKCKTNFYPVFWSEILKQCPSPGLHKLYMSVVLQTKLPGQVRDQLNAKKIPRFPSKDHQWLSLSSLLQNLFDNEIFDVICTNGSHIAVLIAAEINMSKKTVNEKDFNVFLKEELQRREYPANTLGRLRQMKYPEAVAKKGTFKGKHSSNFIYTRKKK